MIKTLTRIAGFTALTLVAVTSLHFSAAYAAEVTGTLSSSGVVTTGGSSTGTITGTVGGGSTLSGTVTGGTASGGGSTGNTVGNVGGGSGGGGGVPLGQLASAEITSPANPTLPNTGAGSDKYLYALAIAAILGLVFLPFGVVTNGRKK